MNEISTRKIEVFLQELQAAFERADANDNGVVTDASDGPVIVRQGEKDYFVPLAPDLDRLSRSLLDSKGAPQPIVTDPSIPLPLSVVREEGVLLVDQGVIQRLMALQGNNPVTLGAVAVAFPRARFREKGPALKEICDIPIGGELFLRDCLFLTNGALSLTGLPSFRGFLERNAPSIAQLLSNNPDHPKGVCHTAEAFTTSECHPDKWSATHEQLIAHAERLVARFGDNGVPEEIRRKAAAVLQALQEADPKDLPGVSVDDDQVTIDIGKPETVQRVLAYLHANCPPTAELSCDPSDREQIAFRSGYDVEGTPTNEALAVALFSLMDSLTSSPLQIEFDKEDAEDPSRLNAKFGRPAVIANVSIPFSYLAEGIFDRAVFSYTLANAVSFLPRGNLDGSIYGTGVGKPFHQGDNEAIRGVVDWDPRGNLRMLERYANEHGATPPLRKPYVATGYRSGAIAALDDIPPDADGVYLARISGRGVVSGGATALIQLTASWQGRGMSAMEGGVTPDMLNRRKPAVALLVPGDRDGNPIQTEHDPIPAGAEKIPRLVYHLSILDPRGPHGFLLGGGKGPPGALLGDDGGPVTAARRKIQENRLGRNHVVEIGGGYALRSRAGRVSLGYHPFTEAQFGDWLLSPYVFLPVRRRTLDWPRANLHLLVGDETGGQLSADLDLVHLAGGYAFADRGRIMAEVNGGGTATASLNEFSARAGVMGRGAAYLAFDFHDVATLRAGYEARISTNEYPHESGRHWEHFVGLTVEQRFNESLFR